MIMQPEFQQSCWPRSSSTAVACSWLVLLVAMQIMLFSLWFSAGPGRAHRRQRQRYASRFCHALCSLWLAALIVDNGSGMARGFCHALCSLWLTALIVDYGSGMACWFYLALCSLRLMAGCRDRRRHRQCYVHGWLCWYAVFFVCLYGFSGVSRHFSHPSEWNACHFSALEHSHCECLRAPGVPESAGSCPPR